MRPDRQGRISSNAAALGIAALLASGCAASTAGGVTAANTVISGQLSGVSLLMSALEESQATGLSSDFNAQTITNYGVRCVTLSGTPQSGEGSCDSSGNFSLSLASATSVPIGCFVIQGSGASASVVAVMAFQGTTTGLDGNPQRQGSYVAGNGASGVSFGSITVDLTKGQATVTQSNIKQTGGTTSGGTGTFVDITGLWSIHATATVPSGYAAVCPAGTQNCNGPIDGQTIYFSEYNATDNTSAMHHGLSIWQSQAALTSCGGEGITLPGGWAPAANANNPNQNLMTAAVTPSTFQNPANILIQNNGGQNFCGITGDGTHTHCSDIGVTYTWLSGVNGAHWGMTPAQCQFYCTLNGSWNVQTGCPTQQNVNWNGFGAALSGITPSWNGTAWTVPAADNPTQGGGLASYLNGAISFSKNPRNRFMSNELVISGNVGTLVSSDNRTQNACTSYDASNNCVTPVTCHVTQNNRLTITQSSSTSATVELVQITSVSNTDAAPCTTDTQSHIGVGQTSYLFNVTKP